MSISGKLTCADEAEAGGEELSIYEREAGGEPGAKLLSTAQTDADGSFELPSDALARRTVFIVRCGCARRGARVAVMVSARVTLAGPSPGGSSLAVRGGSPAAGGSNRVTFSGAVLPGTPGTRVALRVQYEGGPWRTVAFGRLTADGRYSISHSFRTTGEVSVMAVARPRGELRTASEPLTYTIVQAQNPQLTIQRSSEPPSPGALVTAAEPLKVGLTAQITGVASGAPHQTVTLLARTGGGRPTTVGSVATDDSGAYSFTVTPTQTTVYRAISGRTRSARLLLTFP